MAPKKSRTALARRIRKVRGDRSVRGFARELGVFQQNIARYEAGQTTPGTWFLTQIARKEGVDLNWLLLGRGER